MQRGWKITFSKGIAFDIFLFPNRLNTNVANNKPIYM